MFDCSIDKQQKEGHTILKGMSLESEVSKSRKKDWRILVIDDESKRLLTSCLRMQDIMDTGIVLVESITKLRKSMPMEAIYVLFPDRSSIDHLLQDFSKSPIQYTHAHVFFTIALPREYLQRISTSGCLKYFKALTQLNLGFLPIETHLFSMSCADTAKLYTCPVDQVRDRGLRLERMAEQLATVCVALNEYPKIRYRKRPDNLELARLLQMKLDQHKSDNPQLGQGAHKNRSILLLLDRGTDPLTPMLRDLTLQALVRDLAKIEGNIYKFDRGQEFELTDKDKLWKEMRHEHIANVSRILSARVREFASSKQHFMSTKSNTDTLSSLSSSGSGEVNQAADLTDEAPHQSRDVNVRALQSMVHEMPQYKREVGSYNGLVSITDFCLSACKNGVNRVCEVEQDLVMGQTAAGESLQDPMRLLVEVLSPDTMSEVERFRLVVIFILSRGGISEAHLDKLLNYARLSLSFKSQIAALSSILGARLINLSGSTFDSPLLRNLCDLSSAPAPTQFYLPSKGKRIDHSDAVTFTASRWTPYLEDLLEQCISDTMDSQNFPFLLGANSKDLRGLGVPGSKLLPPSSTLSVDTGGRGPSARFRAPSPLPPGPLTEAAGRDRNSSLRHRRTGSATPSTPDEIVSILDHCGPRLIVFIVGGVTWAESRVCYSITQKCIETRLNASDQSVISNSRGSGLTVPAPILRNGGGTGWNWEVVVGGTEMLTPEIFYRNLSYLADYC